MTRRTLAANAACYLALLLVAAGFAYARGRVEARFAAQSAPDTLPAHGATKTPPDEHARPFFSLHTSRTYATTDRARVFVNYRGVQDLDFRIYRVKNPVEFFRRLDNPHQVGEDEQAEVGKMTERKPDFLERLRQLKSAVYGPVRRYVRAQLRNQSRRAFNQKFRAEEDDTSNRTPLNVADYARVPLLNPDQMVSSWREKLPPLEDVFDRRMISLGRREPGVYLVEAVAGDLRAYGITVVTDLATVQKTSPDGSMLVYAVERRTGVPREGVRVRVLRGKRELTSDKTDAQGLLRLKVAESQTGAGAGQPAADGEEAGDGEEGEEGEGEDGSEDEGGSPESYLVMATDGEHFSISDLDSYYFGGEGGAGGEELTSYLYTDRPVYRPEQKVYFKGILRRRTQGGYRPVGASTVSVSVEDPSGGRIYERELPLSPRGTFSGELDLPEEAALGMYNLTAAVGEQTANGYFNVEEYRKPEYKVRVTTPQTYVRAGERARFTVSANYFFGAPVTRADVKYYVHRSRHYSWWGEGEEAEPDEFGSDPTAEEGGAYGYDDQMVLEGEGRLNEQGRLEIEFDVPRADSKETWDYTYSVQAQVTDAARRTIDGAASLTAVRSNVTATAEPDRDVYQQGDTARVSIRARDREGRPVRTRVKLSFFEQRWAKVVRKTEDGYEYADYEVRERELSSAAVETDERGEAAHDYPVTINGAVRIKTTIEEDGRPVTSEAGMLWVADREGRWSDVSYAGDGEIKLVPDKKSYRPGETARVLALLPKDAAHLLVTTELSTVLDVRRVDVPGRAAVIEVPIEPRFAPNVFLNVTYVRGSVLYTQELTLSVPARDKMIDLEIIPNKKVYRPRETASYTVLARNHDGTPAAGAEVSLGVVDESVYQIAPENVEDIRRFFYGRRYNEVTTSFSVDFNFSGYAGTKSVELAARRRPNRLADFKNEAANPLVRKIFKDTAYWQPALVTGADGRATAQFQLPDNLTTWRATARAVTADTRVGVAVSRVVERKDVIVRVALPRFLTAGDTVTLSGVVHNYLKDEKVTRVSIEVAGARLLDPPAQTVSIPAGGQHRIDWRVTAPASGELKILAKALTDAESDALETSIPIHPRGLKQTRAESAAISEEEAERTFTLNLPAGADPNARDLRVEVSPSVAGSLFGALDYLTSYPYGCTEQTMSSFMPNVVVRQALRSVETASIGAGNDLDRKVRRGLKRLYGFQHSDGGWGWWKDDPTEAWMTAYVVEGLALAERAGYEIESARLERGRERLASMLGEGQDGRGEINLETRAYMAYALAASGGAATRSLDQLFSRRGELQPAGRALLALALAAQQDARRAEQLAADIERTAKGGGGEVHWNGIEPTALSVRALARVAPQSELLPRAARWLVRNRRFGDRWLSTRDTAIAVYALTDYLRTSGELDADYAVEVYLGGQQVLTRQVTGADAASAQVFTLRRRGGEVGATNELRVVKRGRGTLYVAATLTHYTDEEQTQAQSVPQLKVSREYFRLKVVEKKEGGLGWETEPLTGEVRSGDVIVSRVRIEGEAARYLLVEDPIPAGCEQVSEVSGLSLDHGEKGWSDWYSAREFRDDRAVFFLNHFGGAASFRYAMRVQVPGEFRARAARVELMYEPDVRANSASGSLRIGDR
jgi:hypothetical protein